MGHGEDFRLCSDMGAVGEFQTRESKRYDFSRAHGSLTKFFCQPTVSCSLECGGKIGSSSKSFQAQAVRGTNRPGVRRGLIGGRFCI